MTLENVSLERHILENVSLERQILETFSMRKCLSNDTFGPIQCAIRNLTHSLTSHFIVETSGTYHTLRWPLGAVPHLTVFCPFKNLEMGRGRESERPWPRGTDGLPRKEM